MSSYAKLLLALVGLVLIFHVLVLIGIVPHAIVWGGRIEADQLLVFETISIMVNLFLALIILMNEGRLRFAFPKVVIRLILFFFVFLFVLNTIGNLLAETYLEKCFALLTISFALLVWLNLKHQR